MNSTVRPVDQPPCDLPSQHQFADSGEYGGDYIEVKRDKWGNEIPVDATNHEDATPGLPDALGDRKFASNAADLQSTGYGKNQGLNVIEYVKTPPSSQSIDVDTSRADRGREA
jgi:hypothetical protein